jgi:hypothetical protein
MPKPPLPEHLDEFLKQANPSVIGTLDPDGAPHSAATWYLWEDGRVLVNMDDPDLEGIDRLCTHYMGGPYSARDQHRVNAWVEVESWYSWNGGAPWD